MSDAKENVKSESLAEGISNNGGLMARPRRALVESPPLLANTTTLLNRPSEMGEKLIARLVLAEPSRLKGEPESMVNGLAEIVAEPVRVAAPALLRSKLAWAVAPVVKSPKLMLLGVTDKRASAIAMM